nr:MAG TPA: dehydrogenase accessory protein [Caudoviricetes sp.]
MCKHCESIQEVKENNLVENLTEEVKKGLDLYFGVDGVEERDIYDNMSFSFPQKIAEITAGKKKDLRELFRNCEGWDEKTQTLKKTAKVNIENEECYRRFSELYYDIRECLDFDVYIYEHYYITSFKHFCLQVIDPNNYECDDFDKVVNDPYFKGVYHDGKKPSRIISALFKKLGVREDLKSKFEKTSAKLFDLIANWDKEKEIEIYLSINPAHILSQSNPKQDDNETLTSCHSLNNLEYEYSAGPSGYCNDSVTFIMFTIADGADFSKSYYRKTSRMFGHYKNGVLLTSRLYTTQGGMNSINPMNKVFRRAAQDVIAEGLGIKSDWYSRRYKHTQESCDLQFEGGYYFGGYADWEYNDFYPYISFLNPLATKEKYKVFEIGGAGTCLDCAEENSERSVCEDCINMQQCECCGDVFRGSEMTETIDGLVCETCLEDNYTQCRECGLYFYEYNVIPANDGYHYCEDCYSDTFTMCDECGNYFHNDNDEVFYHASEYLSFCRECAEKRGLILYRRFQSSYDEWFTEEELEKVKEEDRKAQENFFTGLH